MIWKTYLRWIFFPFLNRSIISSINSCVISFPSRAPSYPSSTAIESISRSSKADGGSPTSIAFSNSIRRTSFSQSASLSFASRLLGSRLTTALKSFRASRWLRIAVLARARLQYAYNQSELTIFFPYPISNISPSLISNPVNDRDD